MQGLWHRHQARSTHDTIRFRYEPDWSAMASTVLESRNWFNVYHCRTRADRSDASRVESLHTRHTHFRKHSVGTNGSGEASASSRTNERASPTRDRRTVGLSFSVSVPRFISKWGESISPGPGKAVFLGLGPRKTPLSCSPVGFARFLTFVSFPSSFCDFHRCSFSHSLDGVFSNSQGTFYLVLLRNPTAWQ